MSGEECQHAPNRETISQARVALPRTSPLFLVSARETPLTEREITSLSLEKERQGKEEVINGLMPTGVYLAIAFSR